MSLASLINATSETIELFEISTLDHAGQTLGLSTLSSLVRGALGLAEIVAGIALLILGQWKAAADYEFNGLANIVRAVIEFVPFVNLITVIYEDVTTRRIGLSKI